MGDLGVDTAVTAVDDRHFTAELSQEWEIWGPMGGYVASVALRAAGAVSPFRRPASFACTYMGVAAFDTVELEVTELRMARTAAAHRVHMRQGGRPILEAMVWSIGDVDGLAHDVSEPPEVPGPDGLPTIQELLTPEELEAGPNFPFWLNLDGKPLDFRRDWPPPEPLPPVFRAWHRFTPRATFDDPWIDACRSLILVDVQSWPSASRLHAHEQPMQFIAPSLDLYVAFTDPQPASDWLLCDGYSPIGADGMLHWNGRLWSVDRKLVATGTGQMLCRKVPTGTPA